MVVLFLAVSIGQASECRDVDHSFAAHAGHAGADEANRSTADVASARAQTTVAQCAALCSSCSRLTADPIAAWPGLPRAGRRWDLSAESHQTNTSADPDPSCKLLMKKLLSSTDAGGGVGEIYAKIVQFLLTEADSDISDRAQLFTRVEEDLSHTEIELVPPTSFSVAFCTELDGKRIFSFTSHEVNMCTSDALRQQLQWLTAELVNHSDRNIDQLLSCMLGRKEAYLALVIASYRRATRILSPRRADAVAVGMQQLASYFDVIEKASTTLHMDMAVTCDAVVASHDVPILSELQWTREGIARKCLLKSSREEKCPENEKFRQERDVLTYDQRWYMCIDAWDLAAIFLQYANSAVELADHFLASHQTDLAAAVLGSSMQWIGYPSTAWTGFLEDSRLDKQQLLPTSSEPARAITLLLYDHTFAAQATSQGCCICIDEPGTAGAEKRLA